MIGFARAAPPGRAKLHETGISGIAEGIEWLRGKEPAWTLLTFESWCAVRRKPEETGCALSLSEETSSTLASNALMFLSRVGSGTRLTTTGNLTRAFVAEMLEAFVWHEPDRTEAFARRPRIIDEPEFPPLHAARIFRDRANLVHVEGRRLRLTKKAQTLVAKQDVDKLNRLLFEAAFWNTNLAYFDGLPLSPWPQGQIGTILWCLSVAANDWQKPDDLVRLSAAPVNGIVEAERDESGRSSRRAYSEFLHGSICSKWRRLPTKMVVLAAS